ncbi:hypothetical protein H2201_008353 [Coniosporium apollinis]|uniref:RRM domain-containing protein n=1 Tax=Coniosporium apollinis TaxID=61459 RepID=A0ABQ9NGY9_9PEZI|nr:hypothetical protein H2201_008353 [Coniosporium apollinis]
MEVSNIHPPVPFTHTSDPNYNVDMDIDMDIDLGGDAEIAALEAEAMRITSADAPPDQEGQNTSVLVAAPSADGAATDIHAAPEKVHIRGVDNLTTADIKFFASELYPSDLFVRVEWIDDTSANIVYQTAEAATAALAAFSDFYQVVDPALVPLSELRKAKKLATHPDADLQVRQAFSTDVKKKGAREASRFYLMNPDKDPSERRKRFDSRRGRGGRRASDENGDYRRRRFDDREHRRRRDGEQEVAFDVSMYDDDAGAAPTRPAAHSRRESYSGYSSSGEGPGRRRAGGRGRDDGDLFANRVAKKPDETYGRLRDRSASPAGEGDGRLGFENDETTARRRLRRRSSTPPPAYRKRDPNPHPSGNVGKELFPAKEPIVILSSPPANSAKELFPRKSSPAKRSRELFPHKTAVSNHRRTDALDAGESADIVANGSQERKSRDLFDRINSGGSSFGRLHDRPTIPTAGADETEGFSIRGSGTSQEVPGFSIRGAASTPDPTAPPVKELFPLRTGGNAGKELFAEKIKGRGGPRRKAEDMYF